MFLVVTDSLVLLTEWSTDSAFSTVAGLAAEPVIGKIDELARSSYFVSLTYPGRVAL